MLTGEQLDQFEREGYLVVDDVLDRDLVIEPIRREYSTILDHLYENWFSKGAVQTNPSGLGFDGELLEAYRAGCDWFQPMDISLPGDQIFADTSMHLGPAVFNLLTDAKLLDIVEGLIGSEITSNPIQHVRIKPPATDLRDNEIRAHITSTDWHQDLGVTHEEADATTMVTVWCAISGATPENGCLKVIPSSHNCGMLPHCPKVQTAIADGFVDETKAVPLPVRSGGIVLLHPLTSHASLVNRTDGFRWSFDIRYNRTGEPTGRSHFPDFVARSRSNPSSELKDWRAWKSMWEEARSTLAVAPHIPIHRWTADSPSCA